MMQPRLSVCSLYSVSSIVPPKAPSDWLHTEPGNSQSAVRAHQEELALSASKRLSILPLILFRIQPFYALCIEWPSAKVIIKSLPQSLQQNAWQDVFVDDDRRKTFCNLLLIVDLILVMPLFTASVERGFGAILHIKTDWRSNLSVNTLTQLLFISLEGPDREHFNSMSVVDRWLTAADRRGLE